jgi:hypothetical protein
MNAATEVIPNIDVPDIRVAKIATADSLSGLSQLEYHLGYLASNKDSIYFRLWKNSGNGKFSTTWRALADIETVLAKVPADSSFTLDALSPMFLGVSVNDRYFCVACLVGAGFFARTASGYQRNMPAELWEELQSLIDAGTNLQPATMGQGAGHTAPKASEVAKVSPVPKAGTLAKKLVKKSAAPTANG